MAAAAEVAAQPPAPSEQDVLPAGSHAEVRRHGSEWEECTIVGMDDESVDVQIVSDGERHRTPWRNVRPSGRATCLAAAPERLQAGSRAEVAGCDADHEGEWDGIWDECVVVADHGATCDVRIVEDGELCEGVARRHIRPLPLAAATEVAADEPVVTGIRSREEVEAAKRKNAIDLDETPAKRPKTKTPTPTTAPALAASASAPAQEVEGLAALVKGLPAHVQALASTWCADQGLASVELIAEGELDDVFVAALGYTPPAVGAEVVLRKRLAKLRGAA